MRQDSSNNKRNSLFPPQPFDEENDDSWQVSYLDVITILLGFLIILLSFSQLKKTEFFSVSNLFRSSADQTEFITTPVEEIKRELESQLSEEIETDKLEIVRDLNDIRIRFSSNNFYRLGSATLQPDAKNILNRAMKAIQENRYTDFKIDVEGHTDNAPISSKEYPSNWELSTARATNVVKYFTEMGMDKERLNVSGFADSQPRVANNDSLGNPIPENRSLNRRVVLRLYYTSPVKREDIPNTTEMAELEEVSNPELKPEPVLDDTIIIDPESVSVPKETKHQEPVTVPEVTKKLEQISTPEAIKKPSPIPVQKKIAEPASSVPQKTSVSEHISVPEKAKNTMAVRALASADSSCGYTIQVGEYQLLSKGFQIAENAENKTGLEFDVVYNNNLYSVRTKNKSSFSQALSDQKNVSKKLNNSAVGLIRQCKKQTTPSLQYQIQLGTFQDFESALNYSFRLFDEFKIDTYMNQISGTYRVVSEPYQNHKTVSNQLQLFKEKGIKTELSIVYTPESVINYKFNFQLQLASYATENEALKASQNILNKIGVETTLVELEEGMYFLFTEQSSDWAQTLSLFNKLSNSSLNLSPVIYFLEYY